MEQATVQQGGPPRGERTEEERKEEQAKIRTFTREVGKGVLGARISSDWDREPIWGDRSLQMAPYRWDVDCLTADPRTPS